MNIPAPVLLTLLALALCRGRSPILPPARIFLQENIRLLDQLLKEQVSCDKMNVTNVFVGDKQDDDLGILCRASTIALQSRSCHVDLEGVYLNLLGLLRRMSPTHEAPCPVAAGSTIPLQQFLQDLRRLLQRSMKNSKSWT